MNQCESTIMSNTKSNKLIHNNTGRLYMYVYVYITNKNNDLGGGGIYNNLLLNLCGAVF